MRFTRTQAAQILQGYQEHETKPSKIRIAPNVFYGLKRARALKELKSLVEVIIDPTLLKGRWIYE